MSSACCCVIGFVAAARRRVRGERRHADADPLTGWEPAALRRHRDHRRRVLHPVDEVAPGERVRAAGEGGAARQVREVRPVGRLRRVVEDVAVDAPEVLRVGEQLLRGPGRFAVGVGERVDGTLLLLAQPLLEVGGALGDHAEAHVGVREAAVLRALPEIGPGFVGVERERVLLPWDDVLLARELGHPEAVDHVAGLGRAGAVAGREVHEDIAAGRDDHLVGGDDLGVRVRELPPPLLALDGDLQRARPGVLGQVEDGGDRGHRDDRQEQRRQHRPPDLEARVAVHLLRVLVGALLVPELHGEEDGGDDDRDADDDRDDEDRHEEVVDLLCLRAFRLEGILPVVLDLGARGEDEGEGSDGDEDEPASP